MKRRLKNIMALLTIIISSFGMISCQGKRDEKSELNIVKVSIQEEELSNKQKERDLENSNVTTETFISISQKEKQEDKEATLEKEKLQEEIKEDTYATITSFGDALCHEAVFKAAYDKDLEDYEFSPIFKFVEKYFEDSTIVIGNLENPMAGKEKGYSGYPRFNAPEHLAIDLKELNVDILTTANNHTLDKGFDGLSSTLDYLDEQGISHTGTAKSKEDQDTILFKDLNGIKTAFLAYTYGTNGIKVPNGKEFCVNYMDKEFILKQINKAKEEGAELIVASMHWGVEYQTVENKQQDDLAKFLIENDVKIILGAHPHVLQPMKLLNVISETGEEKEGLVIFSQGNFFSNQRQVNTRNTAIFNINVKKDGKTNKVTIESATYVPLYVNIKAQGAKDRFELLDLNEIIRSYEANEGIWSKSIYNVALTERERCIKLIGLEILKESSYN